MNILILPDLYKESSFVQMSMDFKEEALRFDKNLNVINFEGELSSIPSNKIDDPKVFIKHQELVLNKIRSLKLIENDLINIFFIDYFQPILGVINYYLDSFSDKIKFGCLFSGASFIPNDIFSDKIWMYKLDDYLVDRFDKIYVPSKYGASFFPSIYREKIKVMPFKFDYENNATFDNKDVDVVIPIRWSFDKGVVSCVDICRRMPHLKFSIITNKPDYRDKSLSDLYESAYEIKNLKIINYLPKLEYFDYLSRSKVVFLNSDQELFGFSLREAMSRGCIPVAGNKCCYPELLPEDNIFNRIDDAVFLIDKYAKYYPKHYIYPERTSFKSIVSDFFK